MKKRGDKMIERYRTIKENGQSEIEIKKSRFICSLRRIESEDQAKSFIQEIKKEHWKANHNCSAFIIGEKNEIQRSSDDGEPSGTAGKPILEVIKGNDIHNILTDQCSCSSHSIFWRNETRHRRINTSIHSCCLSSIV